MNYRILLVEDDPQIREIIRDYFSAQKEDEIELTCARDGNVIKIRKFDYLEQIL